MKQKRREFLQAGAWLGAVLTAPATGAATRLPTPAESQGPFYPVSAQADRDFDLTHVDGHTRPAAGEVIHIVGRVIDTSGLPVEGATVDIWQANSFGRYRHPSDPNTAPLDEHFQGWAIVPSGARGDFRFKTILPGAYPATNDWMRPPHIHFRVSRRGFVELVTQMYFPGNDLNTGDRLLQRKTPAEQARMIARHSETRANGEKVFSHDIVLEKA